MCVSVSESANLLVQATYPGLAGENPYRYWYHALSGEVLPVHPNSLLSVGGPCAAAATPTPSATAIAASNKAAPYFQYLLALISRRSVAAAASAASPSVDKKSSGANGHKSSALDVALDMYDLDLREGKEGAGGSGSGSGGSGGVAVNMSLCRARKNELFRDWANAAVSKITERKIPVRFFFRFVLSV